jgi:hypothetical protein
VKFLWFKDRNVEFQHWWPFFKFYVPVSVHREQSVEREKTKKMQQSDVCYQLLSQRVSVIIMPIFRRTKTVCYCIWCTALVLLDVVVSGCGALRCRMRAVLITSHLVGFLSLHTLVAIIVRQRQWSNERAVCICARPLLAQLFVVTLVHEYWSFLICNTVLIGQ